MKTENQSIIKHRKRRFDAQSLEEYATLAALRLTDQEVCAKMGWKIRAFQRWKQKNKNHDAITALCIRARQAKLESHIKNIEEASRGEGCHARADWRASDRILEIMDRERFGRQTPGSGTTTNQTAIVMAVGGEDALRKIVDAACKSIAGSPQVTALPPAIVEAETVE